MIEFPLDLLSAPLASEDAAGAAEDGGVDNPGVLARESLPDDSALAAARELIKQARRPLVLYGGGCMGASGEAAEFAERWQAPVLTTVAGKGVYDETWPLALGSSLALAVMREELVEADVVVVAGSEISESDLGTPELACCGEVVRIDIEPAQLDKNVEPSAVLAGDVAEVLPLLFEAAERGAASRPGPSGTERATSLRERGREELEQVTAPYQPLYGAVREVCPDALFTGDSTKAIYFGATLLVPFDAPNRLIYPAGFSTLGFAIPAAIGAKLAAPERPVVAITGDGGVLYTLTDLVMAVENRLDFTLVIVNDGGYGQIRDEMRGRGVEPLGVDLRVPDFVEVARGLGAFAARADGLESLRSLLAEGLARGGVTVIEYPLPS